MKNDYFRFFTNCIVTKGYTKSIISDIQREKSEFIPNSLAEVIERLNEKESLLSLYKEYGEENKEIIDEYLDFLVQEGYGFYCSGEEFDMFIDLDLKYQNPDRISNTIIEIKKDELHSLKRAISQMEKIGCKFVALVCYESLEPNDFDTIRQMFDDTIVVSVEIISQYSDRYTDNTIQEISEKFRRLSSLFLFNSPPKMKLRTKKIYCEVTFSSKKYTNFSFCGGVSSDYFQTNLPKVLEAMNYNSCLNKKIAVDINGNIKNCPSMPQYFGNINDTTLEEVLKDKNFKQYWNITKDEIEACKDCEFRYICTDCRAYTERSHINKHELDVSKPLKCGYDPYSGVWKEWSKNPLKKKAISYYGI